MKENKNDFTLYDAVDLIVLIYLWYIRLLIFNTLQLLELGTVIIWYFDD